MKKKIAILTTHRANNYGAQLQSYALTHKINQLGTNCEILDYRCPSFEKLYHSPVPPLKNIRSFLALLEHKYIRDRKTAKAFNDFREKHLHISKSSYNTSNLRSIENTYNAFIAGSDQIWNPQITTNNIETFDKTFLLDFVTNNSKKYSYAASIGISQINKTLADVYYTHLKQFNAITLREHKGTELLTQLLNRDDITTVIDPVLLLTKQDWMKIEKPYNLKNNKYILVYTVGGGKDLEQYALQISREKNCEIYYIQPPIVGNVCSKKNQMITGVGPAEFVWLIHNAQEIITTSFHGSAMGLLFNKILHILYKEHKNKQNSNSRFDSLMNFFKIKQTQYQKKQFNNYSIHIINPSCDNQLSISNARENSIKYIQTIISSL